MGRRRGRRVSVVAYVLVSFGACIVALGAVMATSTASAFSRERGRAADQLRTTALYNANIELEAIAEVSDVLAGLAEQPGVASLDPSHCAAAFQGLESVADQGSMYVLRADRSVVCSLLARRRPVVDVPDGDWFQATLRENKPRYAGLAIEPETGTPQILIAAPIAATPQPGVLVAALDSAYPPLDVPPGAFGESVVVELDQSRSMVVSTSKVSPVKPGKLAAGSWMRRPLGTDRVRSDADGVERIYAEVTLPGLDRVVLAGIAVDKALQQAHAERARNLGLSAAILALVGLLGLTVQRRVARPIADLQAAIRDAGDGETVEAEVHGPAEIAALADEFNATMAKRRELESDLAASVARAEDASRMKSLFLANVSHEIRTPMNGVLGMMTLFGDEPLSQTQRDYLDTMQDSADALLAIINDLLDFSKIEAGMVDLEHTEFPLHACMRAAVAPWVPVAKEKGVRLTLTLDPGLPNTLEGDPLRVRQVVSNLVDNAVKFTLDGAVDVRVARADTIRVEVADTGIGIGDRTSAELFDAFVQGDPSTTRRFGGTGLGLAICKHLVTLMHGVIGAQARISGGSTFWFELPLPAIPSPVEASTPAPAPSGAPVGPEATVLLAEDNVVNRKVARALVEQLGFHVDVAVDGGEAVRLVQANDYVAILMDLQMPNIDGYQATRIIRNDLHCNVPIFALSASVLPEDRERCTDVGMDGHLAKPINREDLRAALERAVGAPAW